MLLRDRSPTELTQMPAFSCPSDAGTFMRLNWSNPGPSFARHPSVTSYDDVGTSYHLNTKWFLSALAESNLYPPATGGRRSQPQVWEKARFHFRQASLTAPSRFVWMHDQTMDVTSVTGLRVKGDHFEKKATAAFMDGHVDFVEPQPKALETNHYTLRLTRIFAPPGAPLPEGVY